jgi:ATP-dependent Lhr-like helicase
VRVYRRLEARGEIRGGRFVAGMAGEHFALPEAVAALRRVRQKEHGGGSIVVSGADPLNLAGTVLAGEKVPALAGARVLYRDGEPIAAWIGGDLKPLVPMDASDAWRAKQELMRDARQRSRQHGLDAIGRGEA